MSSRVHAIALAAVIAAATLAEPPDLPAASAPAVVPDEVILKFKPGVPSEQRAALLAEVGAQKTQSLGRIGALRVSLGGRSGEGVVSGFAGHPLLAYLEPNFIYHAEGVPNDPLFLQQWALRNTGQSGGTPGADIRATEAWDLSVGSPSVVIGIIDSGMDAGHPDLFANRFVNPGEIPGNAVDDDANGFVDDVHGWDFVSEDNDPQDDNGHGTFVAGIAGAAGNNGLGIAGVCWQVRLLPLKFLDAQGSGTTANAIRALDYAVGLGVPVTNNSWGGGPFSQALLEAIEAAQQAGTQFVTSAGGSSHNIDEQPYYPPSYDVPNVIAVAATDDDDVLYPPSNYGPKTVDLAAPGTGIVTTWPGGSYRSVSGPSAAAAFVSGALALVLARYPELPPDLAAMHLLQRVEVLPSLVGLVRTGGRLDAYRPLEETPVAVDGGGRRGVEAGLRLWWEGSGEQAARLGFSLEWRGPVRIEMLDVQGRRVRQLVGGSFDLGVHHVTWDGRDDRGARVGSGVYIARLIAAGQRAAARVVVLR